MSKAPDLDDTPREEGRDSERNDVEDEAWDLGGPAGRPVRLEQVDLAGTIRSDHVKVLLELSGTRQLVRSPASSEQMGQKRRNANQPSQRDQTKQNTVIHIHMRDRLVQDLHASLAR
jgi:hypothetical protein